MSWTNAIGTILGGYNEGINTYMTNKANKEEAEAQRDWEEKMSNTAHQREVEDLKAAGLNPALSATGGAGASTPGGAMATFEKSNAGEQALNVASAVAQIKNINADTEKINQEKNTSKAIEKKTDMEKGAIEQNININKPKETINKKTEGYFKSVERDYEKNRKNGKNKVWSAISALW